MMEIDAEDWRAMVLDPRHTHCHIPILVVVFQPHIGRCGTTTLFIFTNSRVYGLCLLQHLVNFPISVFNHAVNEHQVNIFNYISSSLCSINHKNHTSITHLYLRGETPVKFS